MNLRPLLLGGMGMTLSLFPTEDLFRGLAPALIKQSPLARGTNRGNPAGPIGIPLTNGTAAGTTATNGGPLPGVPPVPDGTFEALDLSIPAMAVIYTNYMRGNLVAARSNLAAYLRTRRSVAWSFDPFIRTAPGYDNTLATNAVNGRFVMLGVDYTYPGGAVNWSVNPTLTTANPSDEWIFNLSRMHWWDDYGAAWWTTGNGAFVTSFVNQFTAYYRNYPKPSTSPSEGPGSTWRELEVGYRTGSSWPAAWFYFLTTPAVPDSVYLDMHTSFLQQGQWLRGMGWREGNHHMLGMSGLYTVGVLFPEYRAAADWRAHALAQMAIPVFPGQNNGILNDGAWYERSPGYHQWVIANYLAVLKHAARNGRSAEIPSAWLPRLQAAAEYVIALATPERTAPNVNDTDPSMSVKGLYNASDLALFPGSALMKWSADLKTNANAPNPVPGSVYLAASGQVVLRSGGGTNDTQVHLQAASFSGGWHGHKDKGGLLLWLSGKRVLVDGGGGDYLDNPYRVYGQSTAGHSTLRVDGKDQVWGYDSANPSGMGSAATPTNAVVLGGTVEYARTFFYGNYQDWNGTGYSGTATAAMKHRRELAFVKPDLLVVVDTVIPGDAATHTHEVLWQSPETNWSVKSAMAVATGAAGTETACIIPLVTNGLTLSTISGQTTPEIMGWYVARGATATPVKALTVKHRRIGAGTVSFATVIAPAGSSGSSPTVSAGIGGTNWTVTVPDGRTLGVTTGPSAVGGLIVSSGGQTYRF